MSSVVISGDTSGAITLAAPTIAGTNTITLPAVTGNVVVAGQNSAITAATAQASTSGTSIDFTSIPSWVKRVTVMFANFSTNGTSDYLIRLGTSGGIVSTGYANEYGYYSGGGTGAVANQTTGVGMSGGNASDSIQGTVVFTLLNSSTNLWVASGSLGETLGAIKVTGGSVTLSGVLTQLRITTVNGTDTFDAGSINILYE